MRLQRLLERFGDRADSPCLMMDTCVLTYGGLEEARREWRGFIEAEGVPEGAVVALRAGYSPQAVGLLLALYSHGCIVALVPASASDVGPYLEDGQAEGLIDLTDPVNHGWRGRAASADHELIRQLRTSGTPGFIIFSSGSTGRPKAVLHSLDRFLIKFDTPGKPLRTLSFLLFDHIAGQDTLFYTLASGGALVLPGARDPATVCALVQDRRVEVLPASPTFLNLLCLSHDYERFDLTSLKIITYGSEPMSQAVLERVGKVFPDVRILQKYGTSEFGAPRARSRGDDSLWVNLKGDEIEVKVVDGILWVRSPTAMLGYLNAASPFDAENWYRTGDLVEQDGDWLNILGRESELINVGGEKVYPQEVEAVILELDGVCDALVRGDAHPFTGQIVVAEVEVEDASDPKAAERAVRRHCQQRLEPHKVPVKVAITRGPLATERQKKLRRGPSGA